MPTYTLAPEERETTINWMYHGKYATVDTTDSTVQTKLDKKVAQFPNDYKLLKQDGFGGKTYQVPVRQISFRSPMSEEAREQKKAQMEKARERMKQAM